MNKINLVADENILLLDELFGDIAHITRINGRSISALQVAQADALVLRSTAKVTPA
ncbi:MAG: erythronate-4-phosphate dehydrogenase, partial [Saprospiraceae bacterium]